MIERDKPSAEELEAAYQAEKAAYRTRIESLRTPHPDPEIEENRSKAYQGLLRSLFPDVNSADPEILEEFKADVVKALARCYDIDPVQIRGFYGERDVSGNRRVIVASQYYHRSRNQEPRPSILTPKEGSVIIDTYGLDTGTPLSYPDQEAASQRSRGNIANQNRLKALPKLKLNLVEFAARHAQSSR